MERHIKAYYERFGYLPTTYYTDKIYVNRENRALLKRYHIRAVGKPPSRPCKEMETEVWRREAAKDKGKGMKLNLPLERTKESTA